MNIFSSNYISRQPIDKAMRNFGKQFSADQKVLDIGCGTKPYKNCFKCEYIGVDTLPALKPDITADAWDIPLPNQQFDGIVLNQSLEHIAMTDATIKEIYRLLRPGGLVIITVPHSMKTHASASPSSSAPVHNFDTQDHPIWRVDYYRFTKFGLIYAFRDFQTVSIKETSGYIGTLFQLINYFFASLGPNWLFAPMYFVNNLLGLSFDSLCDWIATFPIPLAKKFHQYTYMSLPINYVCIFKKPTTS